MPFLAFKGLRREPKPAKKGSKKSAPVSELLQVAVEVVELQGATDKGLGVWGFGVFVFLPGV